MAQVLLSNNQGIVGVAVVTLPIPGKEYSKALDALRELGIGDVRARDCYIDQIMDAPPVLDCLEGQTVNIDELDFLIRSLDRFDDDELAKFQAMAAKREITKIEDLINLSFCSERATVITNFDDLESLGRRHYMTIHGGVCSVEQYDNLNGIGIARGLIASGEGTVTPYGVVYENGMQLEELYTGRSFPAYADQPYMMELELAPVSDRPEDRHTTFIFLPMPEERLERLAERAGYGFVSEITIQSWCSELPEAVNQAMYVDNPSVGAPGTEAPDTTAPQPAENHQPTQGDGSQGGSVSFPWNTVYAALGVIAILGVGVVIALIIKRRSERYYDEINEEER